MFHKIVFILIVSSIGSNAYDYLVNDHLDLNRTTPELIESRNFKSEEHFITTSDGYILRIFRIINPFLVNKTKSLKPIIIQHGFLGLSDEFLISRQGFLKYNGLYYEEGQVITDCINNTKFGKTMGFVLSACGYDVWLSNIRGNKYSLNHTSLSPDDHRFWMFSLDELSQIDLPAIINYVGAHTKNYKIGYVGYSMGSTIMFQLMAAQPIYSAIIDPFIAVAPVVYISKIPKLFMKYFYPMFRAIPHPLLRSPSSLILKKILVGLFGGHKLRTVQDRYIVDMMIHIVDMSSTLVLSHFLQILVNDKLARFDWGKWKNYLRYGRAEPPEYFLSNITSPRIAFIQSKHSDIFSDFKDFERVKQEMKVKPLMDYWIPDDSWTHSDYLFNENTDKLLISVVINILKHK